MNTQELYDDAVARAVAVTRYEHQLTAQARPVAVATQREAQQIILSAPETRDPARLVATERALTGAIRQGIETIQAGTEDGAAGLAEIEGAREALVTETDVAITAALLALIRRTPYDGRTINEWFGSLRASVASRALRRTRLEILGGGTVAGASQALGGPRGLASAILAGHQAVTRTILTGAWNYAREWVWRVNPNIERVQWRSVLDSRTSDFCRNQHGNIYPVRQGPRPPAHVRCRSIVIPIRRGEEPPVDETFAQWLRRQPESVVREVLGPTRAEMYLQGELSVDRFFDNQGLRYTLDQLRAREPGL